jgi:hypothetical protein
MKLTLTPFSEQELQHDFKYSKFIEGGYSMAFLTVLNESITCASNHYRFGLIDNEGNYNWFFLKAVGAKNRHKALEVYNALLTFCNAKKLGKPFAIKHKI